MHNRLTKYSSEWEKTHTWLKRGEGLHSARCILCNKQFSLSGGGVSQVMSHEKSQSHQKAQPSHTQSLLKDISPLHMGAIREKCILHRIGGTLKFNITKEAFPVCCRIGKEEGRGTTLVTI